MQRLLGDEIGKVGTSRAWWVEGFYFKLRGERSQAKNRDEEEGRNVAVKGTASAKALRLG